jgi:alpha-tubulin suppressor-like RCC1 family protein
MGCISNFKFNTPTCAFFNNQSVFPHRQISTDKIWCSISAAVNQSNYALAAITSSGSLWLSGCNSYGQLGDNTNITKSSPVQTIGGGTNWKSVSIATASAAIKTDGTLWMWGFNQSGRLGDNTTISKSSPVQTISGGTNWLQVCTGSNHVVAIKTDGTLWTWGDGSSGALGTNNTYGRESPVQTIAGGTNWKQAAAGRLFTLAVKTDGTLWTWGANARGNLGDNTNITRSSPVQTISSGSNWSSASAAGGNYTASAGIKTDGTLWTWGFSSTLGDGTSYISKSSPLQTISGGTNWKQVELGACSVMATKTDGTLWGWGTNNSCLLGVLGSTRNSPVQTVIGGIGWSSVDLSGQSSFALKDNGSLFAVGSNYNGLMGLGNTTPFITYSKNNQTDFDDMFVRKEFFTDGGLWNTGYIGAAFPPRNASSPSQIITGGTDWKQVEGNAGIKTNGTLWLWGENNCGQLGDNTIIRKSSPVQTISGGTNWKQVSGAQSTSVATAAIKTDGTLWTWGTNSYGRLGTNSTVARSSPGQTISGGANWKQVSTNGNGMAAIKTDGTLWTWGGVIGFQGDNTALNRSSPVQTIAGGTNWQQVATGSASVFATKTDGTLWAWGFNISGRLGNNNSVNQSSPVQTIAGGSNWKQISAGPSSTAAAIKTDGTLWLWGSQESYGTPRPALGDNTIINRSSPVQTISGGTNWRSVKTGFEITTAIKTDGTLWMWGRNDMGQLGINSVANQSSPVQTISGGTSWTILGNGYSGAKVIREGCW